MATSAEIVHAESIASFLRFVGYSVEWTNINYNSFVFFVTPSIFVPLDPSDERKEVEIDKLNKYVKKEFEIYKIVHLPHLGPTTTINTHFKMMWRKKGKDNIEFEKKNIKGGFKMKQRNTYIYLPLF